jgi:hypothetical protein
MSTNDSLQAVTAAIRDTAISVADSSVVQEATTTAIQQTVAAAADAVGKGGFTAQVTLGQMLEFQVTGLLVVFLVLGGLTVMCYLLAWILKIVAPNHYFVKTKTEVAKAVAKRVVQVAQPTAAPQAPGTAQTPATATQALSAASTIHPGLADGELIAILAVAASEAIGQAVSIVSFRPMGDMDWRWSIQGRVDLHSSHLR